MVSDALSAGAVQADAAGAAEAADRGAAAWSIGVPGRPKCCAIAPIAMNSRVDPHVMCGPLSETASRIGPTPSSTDRSARPTARASMRSQQALELERFAERDLDLGAGLLG